MLYHAVSLLDSELNQRSPQQQSGHAARIEVEVLRLFDGDAYEQDRPAHEPARNDGQAWAGIPIKRLGIILEISVADTEISMYVP